MSERVQRDVLPRHHGQPASQAAWEDPALDAEADGFYSALLPQTRDEFVRPRYPGFHSIELRNAETLQKLWDGQAPIDQTVKALQAPVTAERG